MYKKILIATDGSEPSTKAVKHGVDLAKATGAAVLLVTVTELWSALDVARAAESGVRNPIEEYEALADKAAAEGTCGRCRTSPNPQASPARPCMSAIRPPPKASSRPPRKRAAISSSSAPTDAAGSTAVILGSQAQAILHHGEGPVLVVR